jgi:hypothetical protein
MALSNPLLVTAGLARRKGAQHVSACRKHALFPIETAHNSDRYLTSTSAIELLLVYAPSECAVDAGRKRGALLAFDRQPFPVLNAQ